MNYKYTTIWADKYKPLQVFWAALKYSRSISCAESWKYACMHLTKDYCITWNCPTETQKNLTIFTFNNTSILCTENHFSESKNDQYLSYN